MTKSRDHLLPTNLVSVESVRGGVILRRDPQSCRLEAVGFRSRDDLRLLTSDVATFGPQGKGGLTAKCVVVVLVATLPRQSVAKEMQPPVDKARVFNCENQYFLSIEHNSFENTQQTNT